MFGWFWNLGLVFIQNRGGPKGLFLTLILSLEPFFDVEMENRFLGYLAKIGVD